MRLNDRWLVAASLVPAALAWAVRPGAFIVEDSYFYAVVARNIVTTGAQTFNGIFPTNGFHPLWLYLLAAYDLPLSWFSPEALWHPAFAVPLALAILGLGAFNFAAAARRLELDPLLVVLPQVAFLSSFSLLYSEGHLAYLCLSILTRLAVAGAGPWSTGLALAAVFLSRLDSVFFVAAFVVWYAAREHSLARRWRFALAAALPAGAYLLSNQLFFGHLTPISGYLKSTFPRIAPAEWVHFSGHLLAVRGYHFVFGCVPLGVGTLVALWWRRALRGPRSLLWVYVAGALGHFLYITLFTKEYAFWVWYYVLPVVLGTLAVALAAAELRVAAPLRRAAAALALALSVAIVGAECWSPRFEDHAGPRSTHTLRFIEEHRLQNETIVVGEWPGVAAFYTPNRIVQIDLLMANRELHERMRASPNALRFLLDYCAARGYPARYVIYNGGWQWCDISPDLRHIDYFDPKFVPVRRKIGELDLDPPILDETDAGGRFFVWKL